MTENMAARGEGLAGLAEAIKLAISAGADLRYDEYGVMEMPIGHLATKWDMAQAELQRILAALEAAAPAGTAPQFNKEEIDVLVQGFAGDTGWLTAQLNKLLEVKRADRPSRTSVSSGDASMSARALATPSPQAPPEQSRAFSTTSAREQSSATASGNQGTGDGYLDTHLAGRIAARLDEYEFVAQMVSGVRKEDWFKRRIADLEARYKRAAATQEQPAGSAPSGSTRPNVYTIQEVSMGRRAKNCNCGETPCMCKMFEEEMKLEEAEQKEAETGSPRKVGEDGVGELKVGDVVLVEATISGVSRFEDGQVSGEDLLHLRVANGHGSIVRRCVARPSSVPVGEQKQEEGV